MLLYGSEVWGFENIDIIEKFNLRFCKYILCLKKSTSNYMVYGELGRYPLSIQTNVRMLHFWCKLATGNENCLSTRCYNIVKLLHDKKVIKVPWLEHVRQMLEKCGFGGIWQETNSVNLKWLSPAFKQRLKDQFIQKWYADMHSSSKASNYRIMKDTFEFENYMIRLPPEHSHILCKFRTSNHRLPIEQQRYSNIERHKRYCNLCDENIVGDEFHYVLECKTLIPLRNKYLPPYYRKNPNTLKLQSLFQSKSIKNLISLCKFIKEAGCFK